MKKLNEHGIAHWLAPFVVVAAIAATGVIVLKASHADSPTTTTAVTTAAAKAQSIGILDYTNAAPGTQSHTSFVPFLFNGGQTVNTLTPGDALVYNQEIKNYTKACFIFYVQQPKAGVATADVEFATPDNHVTRTVSSLQSTQLQEYCVKPGHKTSPGFNIKNVTSLQQNTNIDVYQEVIYYN